MNKATAAAIAAFALLPSAMHGDGIALDDRKGVFSGSSSGGDATLARIGLCLVPQGSPCIHDAEGYLDFEAAFSPQVNWIKIVQSMLYGFLLNTDGTLRLSLDGPGVGIVTIGAPPLLCGWLYDTASIHPCSGGVQEMCYACGRRHPLDEDHNCSHDVGCLARTSYLGPCTCGPLLVRINWDDDNCNLSEDRFALSPCDGDDEIERYRALGEAMSCCCNCPEIVFNTLYVAGLKATSELRLWNVTQPASGTASSFGIEAVAASSGIGSAQICYELRDATDDSLVRTITRRVTAANMEIRPDYNDDGVADMFDLPFRPPEGTPWQIRVRDEPYALSIVSEAPYSASLSVRAMPISGVPPAIRTAMDGGATLQAGAWTNSSAFASANGMSLLYVDTSQGPGVVELSGSLAFGGVHEPINDVLRIHAVEADVREKWATTNDLARILYDFSDVNGYIWWTISDDEDNVVSSGNSATFGPPTLPPGDYTVEVYFSDIVENGTVGYTSSAALHVIDVRLARLFETANEANRIFNPTRKDDTTGNTNAETEIVNAGTPFEERYAVPRNYLYTVGDPATGNFNVSARFDATGAEGCTNYYCAFYQPGGQKVPGTETNVDLSAQATAFSLPAPALITNVVWELRGGLDVNGNAALDDDEATPFAIYTNSANVVKHACIKGITREQYNEFRQATDNDVFFQGDTPAMAILPHARTLLALFYENGSYANLNPDYQPDSYQVISNGLYAFSDNGDCFSEWLTHNNGLDFLPNGYAQIVQYDWDEDSAMSKFMIYRTPFEMKRWMEVGGHNNLLRTSTSRNLEAFYNASVKSIAESHLSNAADGTEATFPLNGGWYGWSDFGSYNVFANLSPSWVPGITIDVGAGPGYGNEIGAMLGDGNTDNGIAKDFDAHATIGRGRMINPRYRFTVRKSISLLGLSTTYEVVSVEFACVLTDLYDFNFEDGGRAAKAAVLQLGYGNGSVPGRIQNGKVFRHQMTIRHTYTNPF